MLNKNLFEQILLNPALNNKVDRLQIVSGYATASMAKLHIERLQEHGKKIDIELIVGMTLRGGIEKTQHKAFQDLVKNCPKDIGFSCRYVVTDNPVHAKIYCYLSGDQPKIAYIGSANYTLNAFFGKQVETMSEAIEHSSAVTFFDLIRKFSEDCSASDIEDKIKLTDTPQHEDIVLDDVVRGDVVRGDAKDRTVDLSFLDRSGETPKRSGINWGQRAGRDKNQAYISIPKKIRDSDFFPERMKKFTVMTDDDKQFTMVRAQDEGKGLHTPENNALLGKYLRKRIKVPSGAFVSRKDLDKYGRTDVSFTIVDEETYLMDFSSEDKAKKR